MASAAPPRTRFEHADPILSVRSIAVSLAYYQDILRFPQCAMGRGVVHIRESRRRGIYLCQGDQGCPGTWVWVGVEDGFALLRPVAQHWRESNIMKIPNANLLGDLGGSDRLGGRLWRLPPYSANTWRRHVESWELYFLLEGLGRMRVGKGTLTVPRHGCVLVDPRMLRQVFSDTPDDSLWLIVAAPQEGQSGTKVEPSHFYPEDPKSLPPELAGRVWPRG